MIYQGQEETIRIVSMNKDFHVKCYICEVCTGSATMQRDHCICAACYCFWKTNPLPSWFIVFYMTVDKMANKCPVISVVQQYLKEFNQREID